MSSATTRTSSLPLLLTMLAAFATAILPQRWALAQSTPPPPSPTDPISDGTGGPSSLALPTPGAETPDAQTTVDLKTGTATSRFAFELPKARGDAQPTLALAYSSAVGTGFAGVGWTLSLPSIVRKGAAGLPRFTDDVFTASAAALAAPTATFDEYLADGQLLVPICGVSTCGPQLQPGERLPSSLAGTSLTGWMYFRREVDDGARYFFSPDGQTWLKQEKSGHVTQFGHPLDGVPTLTDGIERPAPFTNLPSQTSLATAVYRWNIVREADASGNTVYYAWTNNASLAPGGTVPDIQYLSDVYDTLAPGRAPAPTAFAHHVHLTWTLNFPLPSVLALDPPVPPPPDAHNVPTPWNPTFSSVTPPIQIVNPIWRAVPFAQLATLDVTSASWSSSSRALVRRYSLGYQSNTWTTRNRLSGITLEGECEATGGAPAPIAEVNNVVPNPSGCGSPTTLQLATYDYYPDTIGGGAPQFTTLGTAFASSNLDPPNIPSDNLIQNVTGDGAADYVSVPLTGSGFSVQSFSSTTSTSLSASDTARLVPSYAPQSCYSTGNGPNGELNGTCLTFHPLMFGDWLANGSVNWLTFDGPLVTQGPPTAGAWNAYTPLANSFVATSVNAGLCDVSDYCDSGRAFDVDGDGLTDMGLIPNSTMSAAFITQRAHDGSIAPFSTMTPLFGDWGPPDTDLVLPFKSVADLDGDGLSDILAVRGMYPFGAAKDGFTSGTDMIDIWINRGDGTYGLANTIPATANERFISYELVGETLAAVLSPFNALATRMADVNGDGLADIVYFNSNDVTVWFNTGPYPWAPVWASPVTISLPSLSAVDPTRSIFSVADIDGSGVPHILVSRSTSNGSDAVVYEAALMPGSSSSLGAPPTDTYPGLLRTVSVLGGATQTIAYQSVRSMPNVNGVVPVPAWAVTSISKTNGLPSTSSQSRSSTTSYTYQTPVYDARDKLFTGFKSVTESHSGDAGAPGLVRTSTFATTGCGSATGILCTGEVDYGWVRAIRGLVDTVDEKDTSGNELTTKVNQYAEHSLYTGLDGRHVRRVPLQQTKTYLWDPANQAAGGSSPGFPFSNTRSTYYETATAASSSGASAALPAGGKPARVQQSDEDDLGNAVDTVDFGQPGVDTPILSTFHWSLPTGDTTGWNYRVDQTSVGYATDASGTTLATPPARSYTSTYDSLGRLSTKHAVLANVPAPPSGFAAQAPPDASENGVVCLAGCGAASPGIHYDAYGNVTQNAGPSNRCTAATYDSLFAQFAQVTTVYSAGCGSANPLQTVRVFDRGFEEVTQQSGPSAPSATPRLTRRKYDPFGRVVEVDQPSAQLSGTTDPAPAFKVLQYNDAGPIRQVHYQTVDGPPRGAATYQDHYQYIDGYGDTLANLVQDTDTDVAGTNAWIVSGVQLRYQNGLVRQNLSPFFVYALDSPSTFSVEPYVASANAVAGSYPFTLSSYDGAGRVLAHTDSNGFVTTYSYQCNLSNAATAVTVTDPEQSAASNGSHQGSFTTTSSDGHGRVTEIDQHLNAVSAGSGVVSTMTSYTATGERQTILQTYPTGSHGRTMQYDTLGRMVAQSEPNVGAWRYEYNDAGDLVQTTDARGCGEVVYHDGLGRVTAHDYSPCQDDQSAYSVPNLTTGDGTEAFLSYDAYGAIASESDRAQRSTYKYDPRGRMTQQQTQIAVPGSSDVLSKRYAPRLFTKGLLSYSQANRLLVSSTGTDLPDFAVNGSSLITSSYLLQGGLSGVTSSYGPLLASASADASGRTVTQVFGDAGNTLASFGYDGNGAITFYSLGRDAGSNGGAWATYTQNPSSSSAENTFQSWLIYEHISRDMVGNPIEIDQTLETSSTGAISLVVPGLVLSEWPAGAAPAMTRTFVYGDDYRLQSSATSYAGYNGSDYTGPSDVSVPPYNASDGTLYPTPAPVSTGNRVRAQQFGYDWRGNVTSSTDDSNTFFDRSLGSVVNGAADHLTSAGFGGGQGTGPGALTTIYDVAGNLLNVSIAEGSQYAYEWDEVGRLASASRTDPSGVEVREIYSYNVAGQRVSATHQGAASAGSDLHTVQVFDSLVLKNAAFPDAGGKDYEDDDTTEQLYLRAGGQLFGHAFYAETALPSASAGKIHIFMPRSDHLGSTAAVIDHDTGEVVEAATYQPYGNVESDYRPARWGNFREDVRYTGQWDNAEVGLVYMNARYYSPALNRFISPDPLTIHGAKGDLNPYAYSKGSPFRYTDPSGFDGCDPAFATCADASNFTPVPTYTPNPDAGKGRVASTASSGFSDDPDAGSPQARYDQQYGSISSGEDVHGTPISLPMAGDDRIGEVAGVVGMFLGAGEEELALDVAAEGASALASAARAAENLSASDEAIAHVLERHAFGSSAANAGSFAADADIPGLIKSTAANGLIRPGNAANPSALVFEQLFPNAVGVTRTGVDALGVRVVLDPSGALITAFPF